MKTLNVMTRVIGKGVLLATVMAVFMPAFAGAQETPPPSNELKLPSSATPAPAAKDEPATQSADTQTGMPNDPCPNLRGAMANSPDDLSKVQSDIDRFTLCVQRAQLLERLNESAIKSIQDTDASLGYGSMGMGGVLPTGPAGMPPLPAGALGGIDVAPATSSTPATAAATPDITLTPDQPATPAPQWTIREIFGSSLDMEARLVSPLGDEMKVKKGTRLPDNSVVTSITPEGVSIRGDKGVKSLEWAGS